MTTAKEALDEAKQAHFDAPTAKTLDAVVRAETSLRLETEQLAQAEHLARSARDAAQLAANKESYAAYLKRAAERQAQTEADIAELVAVERRAAALIQSVVSRCEAGLVDFQQGKRLSLALNQPTPLHPPADTSTTRYAIQSEIRRVQDQERRYGTSSRVVSDWVQPSDRAVQIPLSRVSA